MKAKSKITFREACALAGQGLWSGAASRVYYALYQACVSEFESRGILPTKFAREDQLRGREGEAPSWPHWLLVNNCGAIGVIPAHRAVIREALAARVKADYRREVLNRSGVEPILDGAEPMLKSLGVPVDPCTLRE